MAQLRLSHSLEQMSVELAKEPNRNLELLLPLVEVVVAQVSKLLDKGHSLYNKSVATVMEVVKSFVTLACKVAIY